MADKLTITKEFKNAFDAIETTKDNFFITGQAGTGKSTLLQYFIDNTKKNVVVCAPTGVAAINVQGVTIHSFFQFPFGIIEKEDVKKISSKKTIFEKLEVLVIDEVSMVRADMLDAIDYSLRINTGNINIPFGGVQIVVFGDLFQLPPVVGQFERQYLKDTYGGVYFFYARCYKFNPFEKIALTKIFRQDDEIFIRLLNNIRVKKYPEKTLEFLNRAASRTADIDEPIITLASTNKIVDSINLKSLNTLSTKKQVYKARVDGSFKEKDAPTAGKLVLKRGAQIMMVKNDTQFPRRWVNGSLGTIIDLDKNQVRIKLDSGTHSIQRETWEMYDYEYNLDSGFLEKTVVGSFNQYPIKLAWAVTVHKSQGKTFDKVNIDLGRRAFAHGQTYVALSRCRSLKGLHLQRAISEKDIIIDPIIKEYHEDM